MLFHGVKRVFPMRIAFTMPCSMRFCDTGNDFAMWDFECWSYARTSSGIGRRLRSHELRIVVFTIDARHMQARRR